MLPDGETKLITSYKGGREGWFGFLPEWTMRVGVSLFYAGFTHISYLSPVVYYSKGQCVCAALCYNILGNTCHINRAFCGEASCQCGVLNSRATTLQVGFSSGKWRWVK